jgi:hypothetical protein
MGIECLNLRGFILTKEQLVTIAQCTSAAFSSVTTLWEYNWLTRPFVAWLHPGLRAVRKHKKEALE